ncbi:unnamed protein product [Adineta steineri]|uniref:Insulin-like domain-containing protein n=1 Tax=Adineta steineri TaxID=433720 RepID=A0A814JUC4_9BILA|nr:unnamed protein product [Adineta steineri]CAF1256080.1 unnamed protein product [Adineta steineri]
MFRALFFIFYILTILIISLTYGKNRTNENQQQQQQISSTSIQICGPALVRMLDMICNRARQLLMKKRQIIIDDDPYTQFNNTLIGDCCLQACTLNILLKYC